MVKCKDCKHWKKNESSWKGVGDCSSKHFISEDKGYMLKNGLAYGNSVSKSYSWFITGEDFGCIHGEPNQRPSE